MRILKDGQSITSLAQWFDHAPPKGRERQWRDGRSAKECARAWLDAAHAGVPDEIAELLSNHRDFGTLSFALAEPEMRLPFDNFGGETRNADIVVTAHDQHGPIALTIEAKADEAFSETVAETLAAALERRLKNPNSAGIKRIEQLCDALFRPARAGEPSLGDLRYQLLTATAGSLALASRLGSQRAVMVIHEFITDQTTDAEHVKNSHDLSRFIQRLSAGGATGCPPGVLLGPLTVPGKPLFDAPARFYIGKAIRNVRSGPTG